jgi:hypothetical protein
MDDKKKAEKKQIVIISVSVTIAFVVVKNCITMIIIGCFGINTWSLLRITKQ